MTDTPRTDAASYALRTNERMSTVVVDVAFCRVLESELSAVTAERDRLREGSAAERDVIAERRRQVEVEGWTPEHDDSHNECQLACAAACYAVCGEDSHIRQFKVMGVRLWPWSLAWWKPKTYRYNLVRAAALLIAEIERIDRRAALAPTTGETK